MILFKTAHLRSALLGMGIALLAGGSAFAAPLQENIQQLQALPDKPPRPVMAGGFCWVSGIDRSPLGVAIYFTTKREVRLTLPDTSQISRTYDPSLKDGEQSTDAEGPVMHVAEGTTFSMWNTPEDSCTGTVIRNHDGTLGVAFSATAMLLDKLQRVEKFVPAQPIDATVIEDNSPDYNFFAAWPRAAAAIPALNREFLRSARQDQRNLAKLTRDQGKPQSEAKLPAAITVTHFTTTAVAGSNARMLSLLTDSYQFYGGAHGNSGYRARLWDQRRNAGIKDATTLFGDRLAILREPWCAALDAQRVIKSEGTWRPAAGKKYGDIWDCPTFDNLAVVLMGSPGQPFDRLRIIAAPYQAGPYSDGAYDITFPVTAAILAQVKPAYRDAFKVFEAANGDTKN